MRFLLDQEAIGEELGAVQGEGATSQGQGALDLDRDEVAVGHPAELVRARVRDEITTIVKREPTGSIRISHHRDLVQRVSSVTLD